MLENLCEKEGISEHVIFLGYKPREEVFNLLDQSDLFVLPSRQEGLPRAMVEAMERGLPCIGTYRGGIPELLEEEDLVPSDNVEALANKIMEVLSDTEKMNNMSARNLKKAKEYTNSALGRIWDEFYIYISKVTRHNSNLRS